MESMDLLYELLEDSLALEKLGAQGLDFVVDLKRASMADQAGRMADDARNRGGRVGGVAREQAARVQDKSLGLYEKSKSKAPRATQIAGILAVVVLIAAVLSGFVMASPALLKLSPVLVPLGAILFFGWAYKYSKGQHPPGSDKFDQVKHKIVETAQHLKERTEDQGHMVSNQAQHVEQRGAEMVHDVPRETEDLVERTEEKGAEVARNLPTPTKDDLLS